MSIYFNCYVMFNFTIECQVSLIHMAINIVLKCVMVSIHTIGFLLYSCLFINCAFLLKIKPSDRDTLPNTNLMLFNL